MKRLCFISTDELLLLSFNTYLTVKCIAHILLNVKTLSFLITTFVATFNICIELIKLKNMVKNILVFDLIQLKITDFIRLNFSLLKHYKKVFDTVFLKKVLNSKREF